MVFKSKTCDVRSRQWNILPVTIIWNLVPIYCTVHVARRKSGWLPGSMKKDIVAWWAPCDVITWKQKLLNLHIYHVLGHAHTFRTSCADVPQRHASITVAPNSLISNLFISTPVWKKNTIMYCKKSPKFSYLTTFHPEQLACMVMLLFTA
jgi:hypothetical protein